MVQEIKKLVDQTVQVKKGIILSGGSGSRLYPLTKLTNKQLLPVYNKPVVYYPLATLMLAGIRDILIISGPNDIEKLKALFGNGNQWNIDISYAVQTAPNGIAEAFIVGEKFINGQPCSLILGDNVYHGDKLYTLLRNSANNCRGCNLIAYKVADPTRYGVVSFTSDGKILDIEEKPQEPKTNYAVTGLYFYDQHVTEIAKQLKPSDRNELEITDLNQYYVNNNGASIHTLDENFAWFDVGTAKSLATASQYIKTLEQQQRIIIGSPEEVAFKQQWINISEFDNIVTKMPNSDYKDSLLNILEDSIDIMSDSKTANSSK